MKIYSGLKAYIYEGISHRVPTIELFLAILVVGRPKAIRLLSLLTKSLSTKGLAIGVRLLDGFELASYSGGL